MAAKSAKKTASKTAKKTNGKTAKKAVKAAATGYKGHREGTLKEKLHKLFDTVKDSDKARAAALKLKGEDGKLVSPATVNTSFSQFRTGAL